MRRSTVLLLAALALVLAACQIRTDYGLLIEADTSAEVAFEISYDGEAAELLGPAQGFLEEEIEAGIGSTLEGVTLVEATADSSDPDRQRVAALFAAEDGAALDRLVDELFPGSSFTNVSGTTWQLTLRTDDDVATDFGEDFPFDDVAGEFLAGEVRVGYAGSQVSMQGGTDDGRNQIVWNPYGGEDLELVLDLTGSAPPPAPDDPASDEPGDPEEAAPDEEPADEETAADDDAAADEDEPTADTDEAQEESVVAVTDRNEGGLSVLLLAAIAGGALLLLLILLLVLRGRRSTHAEMAQPVAAGTDQAGWAPPAPAPPQQSWGGAPSSSTAPTQPLPPSGPAGATPPPGPSAPPPPPPPPGNPPPPPAG